jgi:anaerobic selenocysteine-containing dehydrogenase
LDAAAKFIQARLVNAADICIPDDERIAIRHGDLVRLVAWYGAIRAEATVRGVDPSTPGHAFTEPRPTEPEEGGGEC